MSPVLFFEKAVIAGQVLVVVCLLIGIYRFRRASKDQKIVLALVFLAFIVELAARILWTYKMNNLFLFHLYAVGEFTLLMFLYIAHLNGLIKPVLMRGLLVAFIVFAISNTLFFQNLKEFNSNVTFIECLLLILLALLYFYKLLRDLNHRKLQQVPMFWINMSVLTYFSGALILFHVANDLIPLPEKELGAIWGTHALFNIVHYLLYAIALNLTPQKN
ncbi:hypothetical protein WSM22_37170 [Cytophagales bacterium WSM2-2]|nr:hypothetical protein WSM22_37170 [Cytophagales bacterium WSM2-2]